MKKIIYLFFALLIFSCSKDDDKSNDSNSIEGRWNFISNTYCGEILVSSSCELESYMTFNNGIGELKFYNTFDENEAVIPCQVVESSDVTYSAGSNSQSYIISADGDETSAIVDGNTLTLIETYNATNSYCDQQEGTITEETKFIRN